MTKKKTSACWAHFINSILVSDELHVPVVFKNKSRARRDASEDERRAWLA